MYNKELIERVSTTVTALRLVRKAAKKNVFLSTNEAAICFLKIHKPL